MFASPELIQPAYAAMLEPLIEQLQRGLEQGVFHDIDPLTEAQSDPGRGVGEHRTAMGGRRLRSR